MHSPQHRPDQERWSALVRSLHLSADTLVADFVERITEVPPYAHGLVPAAVVERDANASFDYLLRRLGDIPVPARLLQVGPSIGRDRARRDVPLDQLLTAVRLDFRVLWHALRERSGPEDMSLLVSRAEDVWDVVEEYSSTIQVSYLDETALMARERRRERSALVGSLLADPQPDPLLVSRVALALDVDPRAPFLVAAAPSHEDKGLRAAADQLAASARAHHVQETSRHTVLIARWRGDRDTPVSSVLGDARCAVAPVCDGLALVSRAAYVAEQVADALPPDVRGPQQLTDSWVWLTRARLGDLAAELAETVLRGLSGAHPAERSRVVDTALAYAASGSVQQTATALYCHRNTVVNRLRRFQELTGCDMAVPRESALALLALEWTHGQTHVRSTAGAAPDGQGDQ